MLTFAIITNDQLMVKTLAEVDFLNFVEDTVGVCFGHRRFNDMVILENNLLEKLNPLATKLFGTDFFDTIIVINKQDYCYCCDDYYLSLSEKQLEVLHENYQKAIREN